MKGRPGIRLSLSPGRRCRGAQWCRLACHGMDCNPLDTTAIQSIPMDWYGLHRVGIQPIHCQRRACGRGRASERARTLREACVREPGIGGGACGSPETAKTDLSSRLRTRVRCAIIGLIAQLCTGVRKRPFSPPFHRPTGIIPSKLNGLRLPPGRFRFLVDLDSGGVLYLMPEASTRRIPTRRPADERPEDFT